MARLTLRYKPCGCGVLAGEICDCSQQLADIERLAANPLYLPRRPGAEQPANGDTATGPHQARTDPDE